MPDLRQTRHGLYAAVGAFLVVDVIAVVLLVTPLAGRESLRQQQMRQLWASLKTRESAPWRGLDKKLPQARNDIEAFYHDRFPAGYSGISTEIDRLASENGVTVSSEKYEQKDVDAPGLQQIRIDADISGDYVQLVKFINSLERSKLFFIVDDLALGGEQSGRIKLQLRLETYLRTS